MGQVVLNTSGTNQIHFLPVAEGGSHQFFRGVEGVVALAVDAVQDIAIEPSSTNSNDGQTGLFSVTFYQPVDWGISFDVVYRISGSATSGVDYANLVSNTNNGTSSFTISDSNNPKYIAVEPYADNLLEFEESATIRLVLTNGYVVYPDHAATTITINDNYGTNLFTVVATNLARPIGIDYHAPSNSLIMSYNYNAESTNFVRIYTNGILTNVIITNWSRIADLTEEVKLATVKTTFAGFTNGDIYFSSSNGVGWLSANASVSNLNWCTLTNAFETNALPLRGGLYVDQTSVFSNQLIAVTSDSANTNGEKGVWRVDANQNPTLLTKIVTRHLEGVITLTNDSQRWGPWAGKILTGDEDARDENDNHRPLIYSIETNGTIASFALDIEPEDFDIIPTNQPLYCVMFNGNNFANGALLKLSSNLLNNYVGDLLVTQAGEYDQNHPPRLFIVHWESTTTNFVTRSITLPATFAGTFFEHVTFAPINLPSFTQ